MRDPAITIRVALLLFGALLTTSCQSYKGPGAGNMASPAMGITNNAVTDYKKPYLTDDKMQRFIASMKEEHNPMELIFKQGGQTQNPASMSKRIDEFNGFSRKYGFQDYQDYTAVWGRIMAGQMQMMGEEAFKGMISGAQAELKKPDLAPEMRKVYEDQIASAQKSLDDMNKKDSRSSLNPEDMELVKKYKDQIDAAEKKYNAKP